LNVFLTGATGFLGGELAVFLSQFPEVKRLYCLVRADDATTAWKRIERVFQFHGDTLDGTKVIPVVGNLEDHALVPQLSLLDDLRDVNVVIHAAADTSFSPARSASVERVNIGGTRRILDWVTMLPELRTFVYVGTASICGTDLVNSHVYEDQSPNPCASHLVRYCHTKSVGEMEVGRTIPKDKLLIVRPSIIMGDSRDWRPRSYVILWALAVMNAIRLVPAHPLASIDIIPVDYAAQAIATLLFSRRRWTTYHISAGRQSATNLRKVLGLLSHLSPQRPGFRFVRSEMIEQMKRWPKKLGPSSELFNYPEHLAYWSSTFNGDLRLLATGMKPYFRFIDLNQTFDNSRLLSDTDLPAPPAPHEYIRTTSKYLGDVDLTAGALDP
jgi:thioester reductase-like protein